MWPRFGVKVGNSTLCIAHVRSDGKCEVIANKQGDRTSQACLLWDGDADEIECGLTAKQKMATRPKQAVANSFQLFVPAAALNEEKIAAAVKEVPCEYDASSHTFKLKCSTYSDDGEEKEISRKLTAFAVHVQLFRAELELARQYYSDSENKPTVVLSIPSYYPLASWSQLSQAAEAAGFHVAQIVSEPTAAALAYNGDIGGDGPESKYVLTVKCGGLFSHFALYEVRDGLYTQLDTYGPYPIGGRQYTEALVQFICEEFQRKYKLDPHESRRSLAKIRVAAANCKHTLTTMPSTQIYIDSLMDGVDFNAQMSRARFESLIQPVINSFMQTLGECVEGAQKELPSVQRIHSIVLLGATMQIPKLQAAIAARFPEAQLHTSISADEVVAVGCARQATFLADPSAQELHGTEDCVCAEEELLIWHGEDEQQAQVLLIKGTLLPSTVQLDVKRSEAAANAEIFRLRSGNGGQVEEVYLKGAAPAAEGVYRIEADVSFREEEVEGEDNNLLTPVVRLRCV